jgi:phosphate transport system substrate-binding protein
MMALDRASRWIGALWILAVSTMTVPGDTALAAATFDGTTAEQADTPLPSYHPQPAVPPKDAGYVMPDGTIRIVGFDDMEGMILKLNALFTESHPGTKFSYVKANSYGALYSLMWDSTVFAPMALEYQSNLIYTDIVHGPSFAVRVAHASMTPGAKLSPIAVVVNKSNPVDTLSIAQLMSVFTEPLRRHVYSHWGQLDVKGELAAQPIHPCGLPWSDHYPSQDPTFGEYAFTRKLGGGQPVVNYAMFNTYAAVLRNVASDPLAIGLVAANEVTAEVKILNVTGGDLDIPSHPSVADIQNGRYPLDRYLYLYGRLVSGKPFDPFVREYMRMVLSKEGQQIIADDPHGYIPLNAVELTNDLEQLR